MDLSLFPQIGIEVEDPPSQYIHAQNAWFLFQENYLYREYVDTGDAIKVILPNIILSPELLGDLLLIEKQILTIPSIITVRTLEELKMPYNSLGNLNIQLLRDLATNIIKQQQDLGNVSVKSPILDNICAVDDKLEMITILSNLINSDTDRSNPIILLDLERIDYDDE